MKICVTAMHIMNIWWGFPLSQNRHLSNLCVTCKIQFMLEPFQIFMEVKSSFVFSQHFRFLLKLHENDFGFYS